MTVKGDAKFKGKLTRGKLTHIRKLVNFHGNSWKSDNLHFDGFLLLKIFRWKDTKELCLMTLMSDAKFEVKLALGSKNHKTNLVNFNMSSGKSENLHFDVVRLWIAYKVSAKKV